MNKSIPGVYFDFATTNTGSDVVPEVTPLYKTAVAIKAQRGKVGEMIWCPDFATAKRELGAETFNHNNPKYAHPDVLLIEDTLARSGCFIARLGADDMRGASQQVAIKVDSSGFVATSGKCVDAEGNSTFETFGSKETSPRDFDVVLSATKFGKMSEGTRFEVAASASADGMITFKALGEDDDMSFIGYLETFVEAPAGSIGITVTSDANIGTPTVYAQMYELGGGSVPDYSGYYTEGFEDYTTEGVPADVINTCDITGVFKLPTLTNANGDVVYLLPPKADGSLGTYRILVGLGSDATASTDYMVNNASSIISFVSSVSAKGTASATPIFAAATTSVGDYGNSEAFDLSVDSTATEAEIAMLGSWPYRLSLGSYDSTDSFVPYQTDFGANSFTFTPVSSAIDVSTGQSAGIGFQQQLQFESGFPIGVKVSEVGILSLANDVKLLIAGGVSTTTDAWAAFCTCVRMEAAPTTLNLLNGQIYLDIPEGCSISSSVVANNGAIKISKLVGVSYTDNSGGSKYGLTSNTRIKLAGGYDGDEFTNWNTALNDIEAIDSQGIPTNPVERALITFWETLDQSIHIDMPRFPFNHIIDTGHSLKVKEAMTTVLACRQDVMLVFTPWNYSLGDRATNADLVAATGTLYTKIVANKASLLFGTPCFRAIIIRPVGYVDPTFSTEVLPHTMWLNRKMATLHGSTAISGDVTGNNAIVDMFVETLNFAYTEGDKEKAWGTCLNYCQYYNMTDMHYPALITVFEDKTDLYSDYAYAVKSLYMIQMVPQVYKTYANVNLDWDDLASAIHSDLSEEATRILAGTATFDITVTRTALDKQRNFALTINFVLKDAKGKYVWAFNVIASM